MGDLIELMHANEKLGPTTADVSHINAFVRILNNVVLLILVLVIMAHHTLGQTNVFLFYQLMKGLIDV
jgi:hypothetical protein